MSIDTSPVELIDELHRRQGEMYAGGSVEAVLELLAEDVVWRVPGASPIAGQHRGRVGVAAYFERRRQLADATMRMHPGAVIAADNAVAQLVEGRAVLADERVSWGTVGVYRVDDGLVREVWLVPLDLERFDTIWSGRAE
jgi:ketosteroid isomerase-like protein